MIPITSVCNRAVILSTFCRISDEVRLFSAQELMVLIVVLLIIANWIQSRHAQSSRSRVVHWDAGPAILIGSIGHASRCPLHFAEFRVRCHDRFISHRLSNLYWPAFCILEQRKNRCLNRYLSNRPSLAPEQTGSRAAGGLDLHAELRAARFAAQNGVIPARIGGPCVSILPTADWWHPLRQSASRRGPSAVRGGGAVQAGWRAPQRNRGE